ncbi:MULTISPECIES: winged helix-turn-helix domain-containing protein [unclassified Streptomyces]|uniref:AfsR/SARP family transcriptional regulator n=1 Tax=unclassified Streptomyces TaxID=2593676 RepID=UPI0035DAC686
MGPARQRRVLAVLLLEADRVVTVDELVDRVWGEQAPQRARSTLYSYLSRLRLALRTAAEEVQIARRSGGYVLAVAATAVDVHRFRGLAARARTTAHAGDEALTLVHLGQAYRATEAVESARGALREALGIYVDLHVLNPEVERARVLLRELDGPPVPDGPDSPFAGGAQPRCSVAMMRWC